MKILPLSQPHVVPELAPAPGQDPVRQVPGLIPARPDQAPLKPVTMKMTTATEMLMKILPLSQPHAVPELAPAPG